MRGDCIACDALLFSDLAVKAAKSENKKGFSMSEKAWITASEGVAT